MQDKYTSLINPDIERFWSKVDTSGGPDSCWIWLTGKNRLGYGQFHVGRAPNTKLVAHKVAYTLAKGPVPEGLVLDHLCRNPSCVNPSHLEPVTRALNSGRGVSSSFRTGITKVCKRGHALTDDNVYVRVRKDNGRTERHCLTCKRERSKRR